MPELTHDELNRGIAELLGWEAEGSCDWCGGAGDEEVPFSDSLDFGARYMDCHECNGTGGDDVFPNFAGSLDALQEAERGLIERGWEMWVQRQSVTDEWFTRFRSLGVDTGWHGHEDRARSEADALYAALKAEKEAGE